MMILKRQVIILLILNSRRRLRSTRSFDMEIEPFFPKHRQKRGEKCTCEGVEQDGLNLNRGSLLTWCHRDAELTWDPGGALGSIVRTIKPISL